MHANERFQCANFRFSTSCVACLVDYVFCSNNSPVAVNLLPSGNFFLISLLNDRGAEPSCGLRPVENYESDAVNVALS